ncbi:glutathione S-transferase [Clavulina sp. PMI_390]|nr:glutathione S-transferase [Clavulina sp. PMI_390]
MSPSFTLYSVGARLSPNAFKALLIFGMFDVNLHIDVNASCQTIKLTADNGCHRSRHLPNVLEELKAAYPNESGLDYQVRIVDMRDAVREQKSEWYTKINPNGRIPAIVHHRPDGTDFTVIETAAIICYLAQQFDKDHKLSFPIQSDFYSEALQWIFLSHGGLGPIQGQAMYFVKATEAPLVTERFVNETKRVFGVLDTRLTGRDFLVGAEEGTYSIADINVFPMVRAYNRCGIDDLDAYPNLKRWFDVISARPAAQAVIPPPTNK